MQISSERPTAATSAGPAAVAGLPYLRFTARPNHRCNYPCVPFYTIQWLLVRKNRPQNRAPAAMPAWHYASRMPIPNQRLAAPPPDVTDW